MKSISTKKKNFVNRVKLSKKKRNTQYGGSSRSFNKISSRKLLKSMTPSSMSLFSLSKFNSMTKDEKIAYLIQKKKDIQRKARRKRLALKRKQQILKTKKQNALKRSKEMREKKMMEKKKLKNKDQIQPVMMLKPGMPGYQQGMMLQPGMPGYQPGMMLQPGMPGYQPGMMLQPGMPGYQPGMMLQPGMPGYQPGMMLQPGMPGYQPGMVQGQYQIAPGITEYGKVEESSYGEMILVLKNFEGNDYVNTSRLILGEDNYLLFKNTFDNLKSLIKNVYKIKQNVINERLKEQQRVMEEEAKKRINNLALSKRERIKASSVKSIVVKTALQPKSNTQLLPEKPTLLIGEFLDFFIQYPDLFIYNTSMITFHNEEPLYEELIPVYKSLGLPPKQSKKKYNKLVRLKESAPTVPKRPSRPNDYKPNVGDPEYIQPVTLNEQHVYTELLQKKNY